jgi:hypothetical protein
LTGLVQRVLASALLEASYHSSTYAEVVEVQYLVRWRGGPMTSVERDDEATG